MLRNLDLFSGIMGFTLGLERTGCYQTVGFCEIEPYCQAFIREKRPDTPLWQDIERLNDWLEKALTLYQAVFPARTYLWQEKTLGYSTTEPPAKPKPVQDSGGNWLEPFAWYDREKRIWRTFRQYLEGEWEPYSETWPKSGMTRNGIAYRRQLSERRTSENASGVLPTPQAHDYKSGKGFNSQGRGHSRQLRHLVNGTLNPEWIEWLMGYPLGWTELKEALSYMDPPAMSRGAYMTDARIGTDAVIYPASW